MNKKRNGDLQPVDLQDYYSTLKKKEKGKLLRFLTREYGIGYSTIVNKLAGRHEMSETDVFLLNLAIENENLWRT